MTDFLHRDDAPFGDDVWEKIDEAVVGAAKSQLSARRLFHTEGPYGLGLKALPGADVVLTEEDDMTAAVEGSCVIPLAVVRKTFSLAIRDIAAYQKTGIPFNLRNAAHAAIACAKREDDILFNGSDDLGVAGLLNIGGTESAELGAWEEVGDALETVMCAANVLDDAGFHGPYALALSPDRYNLLFRRYERGPMIEIEHLKSLVTGGIVKAPALENGGMLIASGRQFCTVVLGQDLQAGFIGPADGVYEFDLAESVALRLKHPGSICVLK
ncbi:MAG: family 1 encapsulin nanocompartment shell protein [Planctomycetota bacterium]